jgi:hypothetical protein
LEKIRRGFIEDTFKDAEGNFTPSIPENWDQAKPRMAVAADVVADGEYLGHIVEGVVDLQFGA